MRRQLAELDDDLYRPLVADFSLSEISRSIDKR
ncbi:hypothetical protein QFZ94_006652 [Paraburkholderia sp. JPY465]